MADVSAITIIPLLLFIGLCGICGQTPQEPPGGIYEPAENNTLVECTTPDCLAEAFEQCSPAQQDVEQNGTVMHIEVRGESEAGDCIVYMRLDKLSPEIVPPEMSFFISSIEGADMVCALTPEQAASAMAGEIDESLLERCDGPLKDYAQLAFG